MASRTAEDVLANKMLNCLGLYSPVIPDETETKSKDDKRENGTTPTTTTTTTHRRPESFDYAFVPASSLIVQTEIEAASKKRHMARIKAGLGIDFGDMLFFDDEPRNFEVERVQGVTMFLLRDDGGLTVERVDEGVRKWRSRRDGGTK